MNGRKVNRSAQGALLQISTLSIWDGRSRCVAYPRLVVPTYQKYLSAT